jgi:hypothetical protein
MPKRQLTDYISTLADTDTVGPEYLAEAIYAARRTDPLDEPDPVDLRPILRDLPNDPIPVSRARELLGADLLRRAADYYDAAEYMAQARASLDISQSAFGEKINQPQARVSQYERGDHRPGDEVRGEMRRWAEELAE